MRPLNTRDINNFSDLLKSDDPHGRGRRFEQIVAETLAASGFDVDLNSPAAKPRQTDLLATRGKDTFLWELKWHSTPADIDHVRGLRDRLCTMPPGAMGVLCSTSGFAKSVLDDVVHNRKEGLILLVDGYEAYQFIDRGFDVAELLERKREELTRKADVWFLSDGDTKPDFPKKNYQLPPATERIGVGHPSYISTRTVGNHDIVFTRHPFMFEEYGAAVPVFRLELRAIDTLEHLQQLLGMLHKELRFIEAPEFAIRQTNAVWMGTGAHEFLECARQMDFRYQETKSRIHHSEELSLFGEVTAGTLAISIRQYSSKPRLHSGELTIRLPKVPLDTAPYKNLAKAVGERRPAFTIEEPLETYHYHFRNRISVQPLQSVTILGRENRDVVGLVVKNPFFKKEGRLKRIAAKENETLGVSHPLARFAEIELLVCSVKDWISEQDEVTGWHMIGIHGTLIDSLWVLHVTCTWKDLKHRPKRAPALDASVFGSLPDFEMEWKNRDDMESMLRSWRTTPRRR